MNVIQLLISMPESLVGKDAKCTGCGQLKKIQVYIPKQSPDGTDENLCIDRLHPPRCKYCNADLTEEPTNHLNSCPLYGPAPAYYEIFLGSKILLLEKLEDYDGGTQVTSLIIQIINRLSERKISKHCCARLRLIQLQELIDIRRILTHG
jgi:hypothetical protein